MVVYFSFLDNKKYASCNCGHLTQGQTKTWNINSSDFSDAYMHMIIRWVLKFQNCLASNRWCQLAS